ncbi:MAG: hypothetical protein ABII25_05025 [bacterium]
MPDKKDDMFGETKRNLEQLGETVAGFAKKRKEEGINFYRAGKLKLDIVHLKHKIDESFKKIGIKVHELYKNNNIKDDEPSPFYIEGKPRDKKGLGEIIKLCEETGRLESMIKNKEAEIEKIA